MSIYLDTSILVALFTVSDAFTERARAYMAANPDSVTVSDFAAAEFASVVARLTRMQRLTKDDANKVFAGFDAWKARTVAMATTTPMDIAAATSALRRLDLNLRTPDAINIAIADRLNATLPTFDLGMASAARALGIQVAAA